MDATPGFAAGSFQCAECGGQEFRHGTLEARMKFSVFRKASVQGSVCLACGHVFTFGDDAGLERIRAWKPE